MLLLGAGLHAFDGFHVVAFISANLDDQQRAHPADWMAAAIFLTAAYASMRKSLLMAHWKPPDLSLTLLLVIASMSCMIVQTRYSFSIAEMELKKTDVGLNLRMLVLAAVSISVAFLLGASSKSDRYLTLIALFSTVLCLATAIFSNLIAVYGATMASSSLCYFLVARRAHVLQPPGD